MNIRELRQYEMLVRVRDFGVAHGGRFPESSLANQNFTTVTTAVKELTEFAVAQMAATRQIAKARATARAALLESLEAISRTARAIEGSEPGFQNKCLMPRRRNAQALLTAGRLFAQEVAPVAALFIARAMPATFVTDFNAVIERFDKALRSRLAGKGESAAARARIDASFASGFAAAQEVDAMVTNHLREDAATTAAWWQDRRVRYPKYGKRALAAADPASPAPEVPIPVVPDLPTPAGPPVATPAAPSVAAAAVPDIAAPAATVTPVRMPPVVEEEDIAPSPPATVSVFERKVS
jgi:hypothetical protein